jgi:hypothetical protein
MKTRLRGFLARNLGSRNVQENRLKWLEITKRYKKYNFINALK